MSAINIGRGGPNKERKGEGGKKVIEIDWGVGQVAQSGCLAAKLTQWLTHVTLRLGQIFLSTLHVKMHFLELVDASFRLTECHLNNTGKF